MTKFKFFRGYIGTLNVMDGQFATTASLHHPRLDSNNEMERWYAERDLQTISQEQYNLNRDMFAQQEIVRRQRIDTDEQIRLFQATTTITVNPTLWTKVKMFGTGVKLVLKETWRSSPFGLIYITLLMCLITFIGIMKLFGA